MSRPAVVVTAADKLACAKRELKMRERVYPRWVADGRLTAEHAAREIAAMAAIVTDYEAQMLAQQPPLL